MASAAGVSSVREPSVVTMRPGQWEDHSLPSKDWGEIYLLVWDSCRGGWHRVWVDTDSRGIALTHGHKTHFSDIKRSEDPFSADACFICEVVKPACGHGYRMQTPLEENDESNR